MVDISKFKAWVSQQPADKTYDYNLPGGCALARFLQEELGEHKAVVLPDSYTLVDGDAQKHHAFPEGLDDALRGKSRRVVPSDMVEVFRLKDEWTFGALKQRLDKLEDA